MSNDILPVISVVVCSYNGADTLGACLEALDRQTIRDRAEIIVVDDGSTDETAAVARKFAVELISHGQNRGTSAARNTGTRAAHAPIVAFTDDDCIPQEDWLAELLRPYERDEVAGVGGLVSIARVETYVHRYLAGNNSVYTLEPLELELATSDSLIYRLGRYLRRMWLSADGQEGRAVYACLGGNMSFRRVVLDAVGLMDDRFTFGSDDEHICVRVREQFPHMILWYEPRAEVRHDYLGTLRDQLQRNYRYGRGSARYYLMVPERRWPTIFPTPLIVLFGAVLLRHPRRVVVLFALLQLMLPQGILSVMRHRRPSEIAFSYLRLLEEGAHDAGVITALIGGLLGEESGPSR